MGDDLDPDQIGYLNAQIEAQKQIIGNSDEVSQNYYREKFDGFEYQLPKDVGGETITFTGELLEALLKSDLLPQD